MLHFWTFKVKVCEGRKQREMKGCDLTGRDEAACQEDQATFKDTNMTSWWALEQEYQRPCYADKEQKDKLLQKSSLALMTGEWKGAFGPTLINLFFNYSSADEVSSPLLSPVPVMSCNNCSSPSERSLDENWWLFVSRRNCIIRRWEANGSLSWSQLWNEAKKQPNKPELTWRGRARSLSECWQ